MENKADIGECKTVKHRKELEPEAVSHREGVRRLSPDNEAKANQNVQKLLALGLLQPSFSLWPIGIVLVRKQTGKRFCCEIRSLKSMTL